MDKIIANRHSGNSETLSEVSNTGNQILMKCVTFYYLLWERKFCFTNFVIENKLNKLSNSINRNIIKLFFHLRVEKFQNSVATSSENDYSYNHSTELRPTDCLKPLLQNW